MDDFSFFDCSSVFYFLLIEFHYTCPFCFLLIEFHCTYSISYKILHIMFLVIVF